MEKRTLTKPRKLSTSLVLFSMIILLALNSLSAACMAYFTGSGMNEKEDAFLHQTLSNAQNQINDFVEKYSVIVEMIVNDPAAIRLVQSGSAANPISLSPDFSTCTTIMRDTSDRYPDILGMSIGSIAEDAYYSGTGEKSTNALHERPFYAAVTENSLHVTQPYIDAFTDKFCISISAPIMENGKTTGVLCLDVDLSQISDFLTRSSFGESGKMILLSEDNTIMGYDNPELVGTDFLTMELSANLLKELEAPSGEIIEYTLNGDNRVGMAIDIPEYNWKLVVGMSSYEYSEKTVKTVGILILTLLLTTVVVGIALWRMITRKLHPVGKLVHAADCISRGVLDVHIDVDSSDEIGNLSQIFRTMTETLKAIIDDTNYLLNELSKGNFCVTSRERERYVGNYEHILTGLRNIRDTLSDTLQNITISATQVEAGADQIATGAQALAQGATEQASSVQELAATMNVAAGQIKENAENAKKANELAKESGKVAQETQEDMEQLLAAMAKIRTTSNEIQKVIKVINDIAFQTNILALNAAVEASRAGDAGKGFAVVADEVRSLASKSAEAADSTSELIESSVNAVGYGELMAKKTHAAFEELENNVNKVIDTVNQISTASEEQANGIQQLTVVIDQISTVVQTNSATSEESAASSEELSGQARMLKQMISQFKLPENH